ncbi:MAG: cell division protein ZapA [Spirochaetales bacterium]|nr:cell division protein ZapA [Spirochaetales bacterium]
MSSISSDRSMHIELLGQTFTLRTDDSPDYIQELVAELRQRYAMISTRMHVVDPLRVAILAGLFLLDEQKKAAQPDRGRVDASRDRDAAATAGNPQESELNEADILARLDQRLEELGL